MSYQFLIVENPAIIHLIEEATGRQVHARDLIGTDRHKLMQLYKQLHVARAKEEVLYQCSICSVPVYLVSAPDKEHFFFRHYAEDSNCPAITRAGLSEAQIDALRFHGQREGPAHKRLKLAVAESVRIDPEFSEPVIEGSWKGCDKKELRRPDVRSTFQGKIDVAFEIQLSTTFGRIMAEREVFYRREGGLLLWVFGEFDLDHTRLMKEVIFHNNNQNAFVVSSATLTASIEQKALILECIWNQPSLDSAGAIQWTPQRKFVRFSELTLDQDKQRAFYVDVATLEANLSDPNPYEWLSEEFQNFWLDHECFEGRSVASWSDHEDRWSALVDGFDQVGVGLPKRGDSAFQGALRTVLLAKLGKAVGWEYKEFMPAVHHVPDAHKMFLWLFIGAMKHYGRLPTVVSSDKHKKWAKKMTDYQRGRASNDPAYRENHDFDDVLAVVFPELTALLEDDLPW